MAIDRTPTTEEAFTFSDIINFIMKPNEEIEIGLLQTGSENSEPFISAMAIDRIHNTEKALDDETLSDFSNKKTEGNEVVQLQTEHASFIDQNAQYYQTTTRDGQMVETLESSEPINISMANDGTHSMAEASTLDINEMISDVGNLPISSDLPNKEIEGNEVTQLQSGAIWYNETSSNVENNKDLLNNEIGVNEVTQLQTIEHECFIYQNAQYYQTTTRNGQMVEALESSELIIISMANDGTHSMAEASTLDMDVMISDLGNLPNSSDFPNKEIEGNEVTQLQSGLIERTAQLMTNTYINITDNVRQIVPLCQQDKIKIDIPQVVPLGDGSEHQTITLYQADTESNNYVPYVTKQNDNVSNLSMYVDQDDPDVSNVYDGEDPIIKSFGVESIEVDDTSKNKITPTKSQTVTRSYKCDYCDYTSKKNLQRHMKIHSNTCPYKCTICNRGLKTKYSLKNHLNSHNGIRPFQCEWCPSAFVTSVRLTSHVQYKHTNEKTHKCTICDHTCVELRAMERHMRKHKSQQTSQCPHCTYTSSDQFQFKQHLYIHIDDKPYKCDVCFSKFAKKRTLKNHVLLLHNNKKTEFNLFKCDYCPVICHKKNNIRSHIHRIHFCDEPIQCERCNEAFTDRYQYKIHYKSHKFEVYECKFCPYTSWRRHYYKSHLLTHTEEKQFHCKTCNKSFRLKYSLLRHCNNNPACKPPPSTKITYVCNICQRSYLRLQSLIRHENVHMESQLEMTEIEHEDKN